MSIQAISLVKSRRVGDVASKAILLVLADYADADWSSWASIDRIGAEAEVSRSTVKRRIREMEAAGVLVVEERSRPNGGQTSNRVTLVQSVIEALPPAQAPRDEAPPPPGQPDPPPLHVVDPRVSLTSPPGQPEPPPRSQVTPHEPSSEPSLEHTQQHTREPSDAELKELALRRAAKVGARNPGAYAAAVLREGRGDLVDEWHAQREASVTTARATLDADAVAACVLCDEKGRRLAADGGIEVPPVRCDHTGEPLQNPLEPVLPGERLGDYVRRVLPNIA